MGRVIVDSLTVKYGDRVVLKGITLSFNKTGMIAVVGKNGAGKSTFAKALAGVIYHDGAIYDEDTNKAPKVGYVWQNPEWSFITSTVWEEIVLSFLLKGINYDDAYNQADMLLRQFGLQKFKNSSIDTLSGGYKQVLAILTMVALSPDIIIFDEVTSMLDTRERYIVLGYMKMIASRHLVVMITQRSEDIKYADRILGIDEGQIQFDDVPEKLWQSDYHRFGLVMPRSYMLTSKWGIPWKPLGILQLKL